MFTLGCSYWENWLQMDLLYGKHSVTVCQHKSTVYVPFKQSADIPFFRPWRSLPVFGVSPEHFHEEK